MTLLNLARIMLLFICLAIYLPFGFHPSSAVFASSENITVVSGVRIESQVETQFPQGIRFRFDILGPTEIVSLTLRYKVVGSPISQYLRHDVEPGNLVSAVFFLRTDTAARYIPPGAGLEYSLDIEGNSGNILHTPPQRLLLLDPNFQWNRLDGSNSFVLYYGDNSHEAQSVLETAELTLVNMGRIIGVKPNSLLRITMYSTLADMRAALPPRSNVQEETLMVEGMSFGDTGVILLLGNRFNTTGVAAHETTHFLMRSAVENFSQLLPAWLNEGLSEYANPFPSSIFKDELIHAIRGDRLLPLTSLVQPPGKPRDVILFYAQSASVVRYLLETFGTTKFQNLIRNLNAGQPIDSALMETYQFDTSTLDSKWRIKQGAPPLTTTPSPLFLPTSIPRAALVPFGSTPTAISTSVRESIDDSIRESDSPKPTPGWSCQQSRGNDLAGPWTVLLITGYLATIRSLRSR